MTPFEQKRLAAGLTQEQFAKKVGVSLGAVSSWENGQRTPGPSQYHPLAKALGISPAEVVDAIVQTQASRQTAAAS